MASTTEQTVDIVSGKAHLEGILALPAGAKGIVLFAHGSGSGRLSPRNQFVAQSFVDRGLATLLFDLLDEEESKDRSNVFDIDLLAERLLIATGWAQNNDATHELSIGYFGASTGAAAALEAAALLKDKIKAVVSRGGRPDLAMKYLPEVTAPTLLLVGSQDWPVISMNQEACEHLPGVREMVIVPGATHLFEEPGALEEVARLSGDWLIRYLG